MSLAAAVLASLAAAPRATSAEEDVVARIDALLAEHRHAFALADGGVEGPGIDFLVERAAEAGFFCVGEVHLTEETPRITTALLRRLRPLGYEAFAIETGRTVADHVEELLRSGRRAEAERLFVDVPYTAAFIDHAAEMETLGAAVELGYDLWGLDQVFVGGARFNLARLVELAESDVAREAASAALERAQEGFRVFAGTGDDSKGFLFAASDSDFEELREAFRGEPEEARGIVEELAASSRIYRLYDSGANYESNRRRIELMKGHLSEGLDGLGADARVVVKLGSVHARRGYSDLNQLDVGNAAAELGFHRHGGSFHVAVTALGRRDGETFTDFVPLSAPIRRFGEALGDDDWVVLDLRSLRPLFHDGAVAEAHPELADYVWGYDAVVFGSELVRAELLPDVPRPPR